MTSGYIVELYLFSCLINTSNINQPGFRFKCEPRDCIPTELFDNPLSVLVELLREVYGVYSAQDVVVSLHVIRPGERWTVKQSTTIIHSFIHLLVIHLEFIYSII